jgi:hypothetical protein
MTQPELTLQVLSTFNANRLEAPLKAAPGEVIRSVGFTQQAQMREYMLAPAFDTEHIVGTLVIVRVEDWLRNASAGNPPSDIWARKELQERVREFVNEITILSYRGKPVWFLACPSNGWFSQLNRLIPLCRTYTNLLVARVRSVSQVITLNWPGALSELGEDRDADRLESIPFAQDVFDGLGNLIGGQVGRTLAKHSAESGAAAGGSPELATYLAGLCVQVELKAADDSGRSAVDRILRTAASFSLTGEKPDIADSQIDALLQSGACMLVSVSDRLGDHGPSGVVIYRWSENLLVVEGFSLSCTVLGKQVEYAVISALARMAVERACSKLVFEFRQSGRNQPMLSFLQSVADREAESQYVIFADTADARVSAKAVNPGAWSMKYPEAKTDSAHSGD